MFGLPCLCSSFTQDLALDRLSELVMSYTITAAAAPLANRNMVSGVDPAQEKSAASQLAGFCAPIVHRCKAVIPLLTRSVPSSNSQSQLQQASYSCAATPGERQHQISNLTLCSGSVLVRKAAPMVDSCSEQPSLSLLFTYDKQAGKLPVPGTAQAAVSP